MSKNGRSSPRKIANARSKTGRVRHELQVASAELGLAQGALEERLPAQVKQGDVAWALGQNAQVERKVREAADELAVVTGLLEEEEAEIERLEAALADLGRS